LTPISLGLGNARILGMVEGAAAIHAQVTIARGLHSERN
jgi:hypothetical protein